MSKDLLNEHQVRRFMRLAEIAPAALTGDPNYAGPADVSAGETAAATVTSPADDPAPPSPAQKMAHHVGDKDLSTKDFKSAARGEVKKQRAKTRDTKRAAAVAGKAHKYTTKLGAMEESEELEEGGAAARVGNENHDVGKNRMTPDRIREEEEVSEGEAAEASSAAATGTATAALGGLGGLGSAGLGAGLGKAVKVALQKEGLEGLDESQVRELVHRIRARILQENRQVQRFATREKKIFALETRMIREIESKRAAQNTEALIENLVSRVATRLRNIKDQ